MRQVPDDEHDAWVRALRERARQDVEAMVPRPAFPVYGLAAPALGAAALTGHSRADGEPTSVTLAYGEWDTEEGPYAEVITAAVDETTADGEQAERSLRLAVEDERYRPAQWWSDDPAAALQPEPPPVISRETLPAGEALVCRCGIVWAAWLVPADADTDGAVVLTIIGRGIEPEQVLLQRVTDLRPMFDTRNQIIDTRIRRARQRTPRPELAPAEGAAALLALAEFILTEDREIRVELETRRGRLREPGFGTLRRRLWQRAVSEHQRLRGTSPREADDAVTVAVNHLGFLLKNAPWFEADPRLRAAAVDETARHTMLAEPVPSEPAQRAWAVYWSARQTWPPSDADPSDVLGQLAARQAQTDDCLRAWAAWAETA
jgi:hypothetical protein